MKSGGFQKCVGISPGISRIFKSLRVQQLSANRRKNRSIQVRYYLLSTLFFLKKLPELLKIKSISFKILDRIFRRGFLCKS